MEFAKSLRLVHGTLPKLGEGNSLLRN